MPSPPGDAGRPASVTSSSHTRVRRREAQLLVSFLRREGACSPGMGDLRDCVPRCAQGARSADRLPECASPLAGGAEAPGAALPTQELD
eukprot:845788-Pyramimonas_sp.AAC.1